MKSLREVVCKENTEAIFKIKHPLKDLVPRANFRGYTGPACFSWIQVLS